MSRFKYNKVLVISDNAFLINAFNNLSLTYTGLKVDYACSKNNAALLHDEQLPVSLKPVSVKEEADDIVDNYDLVFSLHCKQLFPANLVNRVKCINVHPGFNPYNRGWFPQVFSILNKLPAGATIHEIDEQLDHGAIIAQREVNVNSWDTSLDIYNRVQLLEIELLKETLADILTGTYTTSAANEEGNVNLKKDFNALCKLDLNKKITMGEALNELRALTHGAYSNAYYIDPAKGVKVFVNIVLKPDLKTASN